MLDRPPRPAGQIKNADLAITVGDRTYAICGKGQMAFLRGKAREQIIEWAMDNGERVTEDLISSKLAEWEKNSRFATLENVLAMLTPSEREAWKSKYRFAGVTTRPGR
jgi:hypothetical protein